MVIRSGSGVAHSSFIKVVGDARFRSHINGDGDFELNFDGVVDLSLTPDAAQRVYTMLGEAMPELRQLADDRDA